MTSVAVTVEGVFHAPRLVHELDRRDGLAQLVVGHPRWLVPGFSQPWRVMRPAWRSVAFSARQPAPVRRAMSRVARRDRHDRFDAIAASVLTPDAEVVVAWSGSARRTLEVAASRGQARALERGATHIEVQRDILEREYDAHGLTGGPMPDARTVDSELREYELADRIFVPSRFVRRSFVERGVPEEKLATVPYGIDVEAFGPPKPLPERFVIGHVGRISAQKGVHHLLRAASNLPGAQLRLIGAVSPEVQPHLDRHRSMLAHVGPVARSRLAAAIARCSVVVLASVQDGFGMVVGEAMACGRAVVCSTAAGAADIVEDGRDGYVVEAGDVDQLADRLARLADDPALVASLGAAARRSAERQTWVRYGDRIWAEYERMLGR